MSKIFASLIAGAFLVGGLAVSAEPAFAKKKPKPVAAKATGKKAVSTGAASKGATNIADCAKMDASLRDSCISRSRPVRGADLYKAAGAGAAVAAAPTVTKAAKGSKTAAATGATKIDDCAALKGGDRDACISRSAPLTGAALYAKWKK